MTFPCSPVYCLHLLTIFYCHFKHGFVSRAQFLSLSLTSHREDITFSSVFIVACYFIVAGNFLVIVMICIKHNKFPRKVFLGYRHGGFWSIVGSCTIVYFYKRELFQTRESRKEPIIVFLSHFCRRLFLASTAYFCSVSIFLERYHVNGWPFRHRVLSMRAYTRLALLLHGQSVAFFVSWILIVLNCLNLEKGACYAWMTCAAIMLLIVSACNISTRSGDPEPELFRRITESISKA